MTDTVSTFKLSSALTQVTLIAEKPKGYKEGMPVRFLEPVIAAVFASAHIASLSNAALKGISFVSIRLVEPLKKASGGDFMAAFFTPTAYLYDGRKMDGLRIVNAEMQPSLPYEAQVSIAKTLAEVCGVPVRMKTERDPSKTGSDCLTIFGRDVQVTPATNVAAVTAEIRNSEAYIEKHGDLLCGPLEKENQGRVLGNIFRRVDLWGDSSPA